MAEKEEKQEITEQENLVLFKRGIRMTIPLTKPGPVVIECFSLDWTFNIPQDDFHKEMTKALGEGYDQKPDLVQRLEETCCKSATRVMLRFKKFQI